MKRLHEVIIRLKASSYSLARGGFPKLSLDSDKNPCMFPNSFIVHLLTSTTLVRGMNKANIKQRTEIAFRSNICWPIADESR